MRSYMKLYWKEIKGTYYLYLIPFILVVVSMIWQLIYFYGMHYQKPVPDSFLRSMIVNLSIILFPLIFGYSLYREKITKTIYQLHSLPIRNYQLMRYKFITALTFGMFWSFVVTLHDYIFWKIFSFILSRQLAVINYDWLARRFSENFSFIFMLLGIMCALWGIVHMVKRYPVVIGILTFILCVLFVNWSANHIKMVTKTYLYTKMISESAATSLSYTFLPMTANIYYFFVGSLFFIIGLFLYEKYSEV